MAPACQVLTKAGHESGVLGDPAPSPPAEADGRPLPGGTPFLRESWTRSCFLAARSVRDAGAGRSASPARRVCLRLTPAVPPSPHSSYRLSPRAGVTCEGPDQLARPVCHRARGLALLLSHVVPEATGSSPPQPSPPSCLRILSPLPALGAGREDDRLSPSASVRLDLLLRAAGAGASSPGWRQRGLAAPCRGRTGPPAEGPLLLCWGTYRALPPRTPSRAREADQRGV